MKAEQQTEKAKLQLQNKSILEDKKGGRMDSRCSQEASKELPSKNKMPSKPVREFIPGRG